jgi:hypothetical protein
MRKALLAALLLPLMVLVLCGVSRDDYVDSRKVIVLAAGTGTGDDDTVAANCRTDRRANPGDPGGVRGDSIWTFPDGVTIYSADPCSVQRWWSGCDSTEADDPYYFPLEAGASFTCPGKIARVKIKNNTAKVFVWRWYR